LHTKKINGLHENDFIKAAKIDRIFTRTSRRERSGVSVERLLFCFWFLSLPGSSIWAR
jgi:hypothetical protein